MNAEATTVGMLNDATRLFLDNVQKVLGRRFGYVADYVLPEWLQFAKSKGLGKVDFFHQKVSAGIIYINVL